MVQSHPSTPAQRVQWASQMITHAHEYGFVTRLSQTIGVSRPTLYTWKTLALQALERAFLDTFTATLVTPSLERQILTLLVEGHNSYTNIQTCLHTLTGHHLSIGTIAAVIAEAQRRAVQWMSTHAPATSRTLALDEIYATNRRGAYLNVVDTISWAVWAAEGPLAVDTESWTLLLWLAQERGLRWHATISDGGRAIAAACQIVDPQGQHGRDVWHIFHTWSQVQRRVERQVGRLQERSASVKRQAARIAAGHKPRGHHPRSDVAAHLAEVAQAQRTLDDLGFLGQELQRLLAVVVLGRDGLVSLAQRQQELLALLELLAEAGAQALSGAGRELKRLHKQVYQALPQLLAFVGPVARVEQEVLALLGESGLALVGWAWQRRAILSSERESLLLGLPAAWRGAARMLLHAWDEAVRASSAVENWHSIVRPHLAVHRTLSAGMLALLAVWHNHRVFTRGVHSGQSPLQLSGMVEAPTDWLVALGYPPATRKVVPIPTPADQTELALAA